MGLIDDLRGLPGDLAAELDLPAITITRTVYGRRNATARAQGLKATETVSTIPARGTRGNRTVKADDGTKHTQATATVYAEVLVGDRLQFAGSARAYDVIEVDHVAPDDGAAIVTTAVLK